MLVPGAVVDEEQQLRGRKTVDETIEQRLRLGVDPVQILEDEQQGLGLTLTEEQALDGIERASPSLRRIERLPLRLVHRHVQEREDGRQHRPERVIQREDLARHLLLDLAVIVS